VEVEFSSIGSETLHRVMEPHVIRVRINPETPAGVFQQVDGERQRLLGNPEVHVRHGTQPALLVVVQLKRSALQGHDVHAVFGQCTHNRRDVMKQLVGFIPRAAVDTLEPSHEAIIVSDTSQVVVHERQ
jgi:hypothetical protein